MWNLFRKNSIWSDYTANFRFYVPMDILRGKASSIPDLLQHSLFPDAFQQEGVVK